MTPLSRDELNERRTWFETERPGPLVASHVLLTGHGTAHVDRWPEPRVLIAETAGNQVLVGDPEALTVDDIQEHVHGFVDAPALFEHRLRVVHPDLHIWPREMFAQTDPAPPSTIAALADVRRLGPLDRAALTGLSSDLAWIHKTWGGAAGLAESGVGWGAFVGGRLVSVACSFFVGFKYEDIGVITEPAHQGRGLSTACAAALIGDIQARGRRASWTTSPDNAASHRVAHKLGLRPARTDRLYVVGIDLPTE